MRTVVFATGSLILAGCGGGEPADEYEESAPAAPAISIASATVQGTSVVVHLEAEGLDIVPAGMEQANSGHHHLFINRDPTPVGETIPAEEGIVHLGGAQLEYEFAGLTAGEYTITAVLGDHLHVRIGEIQPSTVNVRVH